MTIDEVVDILNEAVTLSPGLWSLFDVQVPCVPVVGKITPIELMDTGLTHLAFANTLGVINGITGSSDERICITVEKAGGRSIRKFAAHRIAALESPSGPDQLISEVSE